MPRALSRRLSEIGVEADGEIVVRRELAASGRGKVSVNGVAGARQLLKDLAPYLADIHGQGETSTLLRPDAGLELLDRFGGTREKRREVRESFREVRHLEAEIARVRQKARDRETRKDELERALSEIDSAAPKPGEDDELFAERRLVSHASKLQTLSREVFATLYEDEDSALSRLASALKRVAELASIDPRWEGHRKDKEGLMGELQDLALYARDYAQSIDVTPGRMDDLESRLSLLERLKKKYGGSLAEVLAFSEGARRELQELEGSEERLSELELGLEGARSRYLSLARALSAARRKAAKRLSDLVRKELPSLALEKARFELELSTVEAKESGLDEVSLLFTANSGEEPRPLARAASGGELSRFV
ncbi:MAG: hypothetical protein ACRD21_28045, partial [Vicinamibacteria bacterium]